MYQPFPCLLCLCIRHIFIAKIRVACINFALIDIAGNVLRNITVEHRTKNVALEIPSVHCAAQIIRNRPDCTVQFFAFLLFFGVYHFYFLHQMRISALFSFILSQFSKIVPIKTASLRYAVCGCCLCIKNANCYNIVNVPLLVHYGVFFKKDILFLYTILVKRTTAFP